ncbi:hypothetical protein AUP42_04170 [Thalassospira lucentensis]|uniref:Bbp19-like phage domain-containing protein n=1 Tax=Thalassospira lucentensis TaxID=168935 RepID=A0A154L2U7_9PROT|nr:hypothetical protein [Thalassospira lucentensis]KZB62161.1 hypothetical protein AUP42_04170 [Thalassospira lucentensis]
MSGWDWFDGLAADDETEEVDRVHWRQCFGTSAGQKVLAELERSILRTAFGPQSPDRAIWMREGQRALVLQMARLARGSVNGGAADNKG